MNIAINEIFGPTIQGEGKYTGVPSVFVRTNGCNLHCAFKGSICDTPYTSWHPEKLAPKSTKEVAEDIAARLEKIGGFNGHNSHIVITGGEPLLQQKAIIDLIECLNRDCDVYNDITIETNGSIIPDDNLLDEPIFWSVSPKLSTSCCFEDKDIPEAMTMAHKRSRINIEALATIVATGDYQLKFVYSGPESVEEIKSLIKEISEYIQNNLGVYRGHAWEFSVGEIHNHVMLMPEGTTNEQLSATAPGAVQACIENGWKFCDRAHIRIWGDKRGV